MHSVTDYVCDERYASTPDSIARRDAVLNEPAYLLPQQMLDQLNEHSTLERNWIGLASK